MIRAWRDTPNARTAQRMTTTGLPVAHVPSERISTREFDAFSRFTKDGARARCPLNICATGCAKVRSPTKCRPQKARRLQSCACSRTSHSGFRSTSFRTRPRSAFIAARTRQNTAYSPLLSVCIGTYHPECLPARGQSAKMACNDCCLHPRE